MPGKLECERKSEGVREENGQALRGVASGGVGWTHRHQRVVKHRGRA